METFSKWFENSKVVNEDGKPLIVYHGTNSPENFKEFKLMGLDLGIHFGTHKQAECRFEKLGTNEFSRIIPVYLKIENPLEIEDIFGIPYALFRKLSKDDDYDGYGILTSEETDCIWDKYGEDFEESDFFETKNDLEFYSDIMGFLQAKGYDGIKYLNDVERKDSTSEYSWVVFKPEQVKII